MAALFVGQRVKKVAIHDGGENEVVPPGAVGTILRGRTGCWEWGVAYDGMGPSNEDDGLYCADSFMLTPLTDPKADAFIERIKKLEPLPVLEVA